MLVPLSESRCFGAGVNLRQSGCYSSYIYSLPMALAQYVCRGMAPSLILHKRRSKNPSATRSRNQGGWIVWKLFGHIGVPYTTTSDLPDIAVQPFTVVQPLGLKRPSRRRHWYLIDT